MAYPITSVHYPITHHLLNDRLITNGCRGLGDANSDSKVSFHIVGQLVDLIATSLKGRDLYSQDVVGPYLYQD